METRAMRIVCAAERDLGEAGRAHGFGAASGQDTEFEA